MPQDLKTSYDRVPDQSLRTPYNCYKVLALCILIVISMWIISKEMQTYLQSFATNRQAKVKIFYPIPKVPMWVVTVINPK